MLLANFIFGWILPLYAPLAYTSHVHGLVHSGQQVLKSIGDAPRVPVILGVMSQCPDGLYCEAVFDGVLEHVGDIVDLQLSFIGRIDATEPTYGVTCRHGPAECTGNIHELCVASLYPSRTHWWSFVQCSNQHGRFEVGTEEVSKKCARAGGLSWERIQECISAEGGGGGEAMLKASVVQSEILGIQKSCTVLINGRKRCVRDDEQWKECEDGHSIKDFARMIREEYTSLYMSSGARTTS